MTKRAQEPSAVEPFAAARSAFAELLTFIGGNTCPVGRVSVTRHGVRKARADALRFALDRRLGLPREIYSLGLRRLVAEEARAQSWDQAFARVDTTTGDHVPKRQAEELTVRAAQDFDAFYAERSWDEPANDTASQKTLLVLSCDGKGVAMRPDALRDATRKQAEEEQREHVRGDPTEVRVMRRHSKRMAFVTAVWDQEPFARSADDIVHKLRKDGEAAVHLRLHRHAHSRQRDPPAVGCVWARSW